MKVGRSSLMHILVFWEQIHKTKEELGIQAEGEFWVSLLDRMPDGANYLSKPSIKRGSLLYHSRHVVDETYLLIDSFKASNELIKIYLKNRIFHQSFHYVKMIFHEPVKP